MPHGALKLVPGVDQNRTPALNEAAISESQLIRFIPDKRLGGLPQKLGGWVKFYNDTIGSIVRALWAWADLSSVNHLAVGAEQSLSVVTNNNEKVITPRQDLRDVAVSFNTTIGSNVVEIDDAGSNITDYDSIFLQTQVSIGGLVLYGMYKCTAISANKYSIQATDILGQPQEATATVAAGGAVPQFDTTSGSSIVTVTLNDHGQAAGNTFPVYVSTAVGGITLHGNYLIVSIVSANQFTIQASNEATSTTSADENGGDARMLVYVAFGPLPAGTGYGIGGYGLGGYGTGVAPAANPGTALTNIEDWSLDNFGQQLIANPKGDAIYVWDPSTSAPVAQVITNAPQANNGIFIAMPQRQIVAWGSTFDGIIDPMLLRWCDVEDYETWTAQVTNQAGSYRIPRGSKIVGCLQGPQQGLIWTDLAVWAMQYIGAPLVYGFNEIGTGCGLIAPRAAGTLNNTVFWMSQSQFFRSAGSGVEPVYCPIWDVIFQDLDDTNLDKIRCAPNSRFSEVTWYYPTKSNGGEVSHYVKFNAAINQWDFGALGRTAWINQSVLGPPIGAAPNQYLYQHEVGNDADTSPMTSYFQTGFFVLNEADEKLFVDQIWPDMKWGEYGGTQNANVLLTFYVSDYAGQTPLTYGPFTMTQATEFVTPRFRGRLVSIRIESNDPGSFWRLGNMRYRFQSDGRF